MIANKIVRMNPKIFLLLMVFMALMASHANAAVVFFGRVTHVTDGDTVWVQPEAGGRPQKLRIDGIDAPEICQSGGEASRAVLSRQALHQRVEVRVKHKDVYGRGLASIRLHGQDVGAQMVLAGQAWSYRWQRNPGPYAREESEARQSRRGLFAEHHPELPGQFRKRHGSCYRPR